MFQANDPSEPVPTRLLTAILLAGLVLRVAVSLWLPTNEAFLAQLPDQTEYLGLGRSLLAGEGLVINDDRIPGSPPLLAQRMPGYPLLVAATGGSVMALRLLQAAVDTLTALASYLLARRWLDARTSLVAAALIAFAPFFVYFSALLLSETIFAAMLAWGLVLLTRGTRRSWWGAMLLLALSIYVRPSAAGLVVLLSAASALLPGRSPFMLHSRWPIPAGLTGVLIVLVTLSPWAARNWYALGSPVLLTSNGGVTLYDGWHPDNTTGGSDQAFVRHMPQLALMNEVERSTYFSERAAAQIRRDLAERPGRIVTLAGLKLLRTWSPVPLSELDRPAFVAAGLGWGVPFLLLAAAGLLRARLGLAAKLVLVLPAAYFTLAHMVTVGSLRYRMPADVPLAVLAAAGAGWVWGRWVEPWRAGRAAEAEEAEPGGEPSPDAHGRGRI